MPKDCQKDPKTKSPPKPEGFFLPKTVEAWGPGVLEALRKSSQKKSQKAVLGRILWKSQAQLRNDKNKGLKARLCKTECLF